MAERQVVFGLGNVGRKYAQTRHNLGWMALVAIESAGIFGGEKRHGLYGEREGTLDGHPLVTVRPYTYMNNSGDAGKAFVRSHRVLPKDIIVVHDDMDLPVGRIRIRRGGSSAGQHGIDSLIERWGTADFVRIRLGIGKSPSGVDPVDHVLTQFEEKDWPTVEQVLLTVPSCVTAIVESGLEAAMTAFNAWKPS